MEFVKEQWGLIAAPDVDEEFDIQERVEVLNTIVNTSLSLKYMKAECFHTLAAGLAPKIVEKLRSKWAALVGESFNTNNGFPHHHCKLPVVDIGKQ